MELNWGGDLGGKMGDGPLQSIRWKGWSCP